MRIAQVLTSSFLFLALALTSSRAQAQAIRSVTLQPQSVAGGTLSFGTVTLSKAAGSNGFIVSLSSSNSLAVVPISVTVQSGATTARFSISTLAVLKKTPVVIKAFNEAGSADVSLIVLAPALTSFSFNSSTVLGTESVTGTVMLGSPAPQGGLIVHLNCNTTALVIPSSVKIAPGRQSVSFNCNASVVSIITSATVTAETEGSTLSETVTINPGIGLAPGAWPKFRGNAMNTGLGTGTGADGRLKWSAQITDSSTSSSPSVGPDGTIYVSCGENKLHAISSTGSAKWIFQTGGLLMGSPAIAFDGTVYIGAEDNVIYAINSDGTLKWKYQTNDQIQSSPSIAPDGTVYCASYDGNLYAFTPSGGLKWA